MIRYYGTKVLRHQGFKVPTFSGTETLRYEGIKVPRYQGTKVPLTKVPRYQDTQALRGARYWCTKVLRY